MFGYIKTYQPELKMGEFEHYRGIYCSLCKTLGKRYGVSAQLSLSYDFTFLALLKLALADTCAGFQKGRCPYNPLKKRICCGEHTALDACADAAVLLVYHKTLDTIADSGFWKRIAARMALPFVSHDRKKSAKRHPALDKAVADCMKQQNELERHRISSVDAAAEPTATLLSLLCADGCEDEKQRRILERFGYCLGRWVYLIDALDDLEDDLQSGNYNPFVLLNRLTAGDKDALQATRDKALFSLNASLAECVAAYELLPIHRFDGILRNILLQGMPHTQRTVLKTTTAATGGLSHEKSI